MRISDWSSDVCSSDLRTTCHWDQKILRRRSEPALTREPGDLPVAVVLRADRVCRADGGEPERRHVWTAFSRRRVVRLTASAPLASVALRSGMLANVEVRFLFDPEVGSTTCEEEVWL